MTRIKQHDGRIELAYAHKGSGEHHGFDCDHVIFSGPRFVAKHVIEDGPALNESELQYAPWLVANITVRIVPAERGIPLAWDNVSYYSNSLGYVFANHQDITTRETPVVLTYYNALAENAPTVSRSLLYQATATEWSDKIVRDLEAMHPGISNEILSMDIWPWGHGIIRLPSDSFGVILGVK